MVSPSFQAVPPYAVKFRREQIDRVSASIRDILERGQLTLGPYTEHLERSFAMLAGTRFAVAVNSGTTAIEIILRALNVRGRSVLVPANTNFATAIAALNAGARVLLYDGDIYPSLEDIELRAREDTAAAIVVHIGGYITPRIDSIRAWCTSHDIALVEDAAHAHGARLGQRSAGSLGIAAAFSFFATKVITTGEGGIITTDDMLLAKLARSYRNQGKDQLDGRHQVLGNSWRMPETSAALGLVQLEYFQEDLIQRLRIMSEYYAAIESLPSVAAPPQCSDAMPSGHKCIALAADANIRRSLEKHMIAANISLAGAVYSEPLNRLPVLRGYFHGVYPKATEFANRHFCLPLWNGMEQRSIQAVISTLRRFAGA
jgi:dTDP-4-amino-4,6-dideoxygalactose transaminase